MASHTSGPQWKGLRGYSVLLPAERLGRGVWLGSSAGELRREEEGGGGGGGGRPGLLVTAGNGNMHELFPMTAWGKSLGEL